MCFFYGPEEMAEMIAAGIGDGSPRPLPLPHDGPVFPVSAANPFPESLARAYDSRGYSRAAEAVRQIYHEKTH